ncbi:MAG: hypothetical protein MJ162_04945 [Treponema sp.]|nr:hypothetical protein [Treponema sp.]
MMQIYFLSVLMNIIVGLLLVSKKKQNVVEDESDAEEQEVAVVDNAENKKVKGQLFASSTFNISMGLLSIIVGVLKLFVVSKSNIVIIGDLFPAAAGIIGGFAILVAYFVEKSSTAENLNDNFKRIFVTNSSLIGVLCIIVAVIHFIIPGALFL